jgi:cytochrome c-type biogenesis protein
MSAAQVAQGGGRRGRMLAGAMLFVAGFAVVFVTAGVIFGTIGSALLTYQIWITRAVGVVTIVMG